MTCELKLHQNQSKAFKYPIFPGEYAPLHFSFAQFSPLTKILDAALVFVLIAFLFQSLLSTVS